MDAIQESVSQLQQLFLQKMDAYQGELSAAVPSTSITNLTAEFTTFRAFIMSALQCLQDQVGMLVQQCDNMEMRSRRKILLLHGLSESTKEDTAATVVKAVVNKLKVSEFTTGDITRCHRMGRMSAPDKPRPILFKVRDLTLRNKIWYAKTSLKGSGITMSEFLTKSRHDTFMMARHRFGVTKCWTREGFVFVVGADGVRHRISSLAELQKIAVPDVPKPAALPAHSGPKEPAAAPKGRRAGAASKK